MTIPSHEIPIQLRFADTDALGHVNNAAYATYAELGRLAFLRDVVGPVGGEAANLILAHLSLDFRRQVRLGQDVRVRTAVERVGTSSVAIRQEVLADGALAAEARSVVVWFDYAAQRSARVPDDARAALEPHLLPPA